MAVIEELRHAGAPASVSVWASKLPAWIDIGVVDSAADETLSTLDPGEREAIRLAEENRADLLLIDERKGRNEAKRRGIATTGTLGVLLAAGKRGLLNAEYTYRRLVRETSFRTAPGLDDVFLRLCREPDKN